MSLDREDLAARVLVAMAPYREADPAGLVREASELADALIARLRPATVAPVDPSNRARVESAWLKGVDAGLEVGKRVNAAPVADAAPRPEWVRIKEGPGWYAPFVRRVLRWVGDRPVVYAARGNDVDLETGDAPITLEPADWEPCAAPAQSPAASPAAYVPTPAKSGAAAYVPQVGDVVRFKDCDNFAEILVVRVDDPKFYGKIITQDGFYRDEAERDSAEYRYIRPATAAERAAAGLPPITPDHPQGGQGAEGDQRVAAGLDAPAVDREGLAIALYSARWTHLNAETWADEVGECRDGWLRAADAAILRGAK